MRFPQTGLDAGELIRDVAPFLIVSRRHSARQRYKYAFSVSRGCLSTWVL